jgi:NAD(P)-dependent dehydrogenase (short-subunit alcohol dehydrogenase family)
MSNDAPRAFRLPNGMPKTVVVTGGAGGIGAQTVRCYYSHGCNVVLADLKMTQEVATELISSLPDPRRAMYHPTNIVEWEDMKSLFRETKKKFGQVDIVVANAGIMESKGFFNFEEDEAGELKEPIEAYRVVDVNLKGTMNSEPAFELLGAGRTDPKQRCKWPCTQ